MKKESRAAAWPAAFRRGQARLARLGWVALGSVVERAQPGRGGPRYQWTRRIDGKTITVALSPEQFAWLKRAIANQRRAWAILEQMQRLSLQHLWRILPPVRNRKPLSAKQMGII